MSAELPTPADAPQSAALPRQPLMRRRMTRAESLPPYGMAPLSIVLVLILAVVSETFRNPANLVNILQQNSILGIVACGMLLMIVVGGFDLSVGAVGAMSGVVAAVVFITVGIVPGVIAALGRGWAGGTPNRAL